MCTANCRTHPSEGQYYAHNHLTARLEARISTDLHAMLVRAAELQGRTMTDFVVAAVQEVAQRAIKQADVIRLSLADQECFAQALLSPQPVPALARLSLVIASPYALNERRAVPYRATHYCAWPRCVQQRFGAAEPLLAGTSHPGRSAPCGRLFRGVGRRSAHRR
jgi:uncharacterized protein (DUF1778 family)